ncbi:uncharacterized protein N0V89_007969 [Didymosphaeria variabile]|uniref:Peptidase A1 domain-containing protein n=1 Tax=Didymosphaeria variabile TaxID=1932322 RepID=A0A9W9C7D4_9PLEO|nr:uncharacterized protein N0V89_007969 [Didymosphaeria variabile]KAJ4349355.1 hypothetical protein N0V89_007969 [Didymosphaeria variabile]
MYVPLYLAYVLSICPFAASLDHRAPAGIEAPAYVPPFLPPSVNQVPPPVYIPPPIVDVASPGVVPPSVINVSPPPIIPSHPLPAPAAPKQSSGVPLNGLAPHVASSPPNTLTEAAIEQPVDTLGGRVYMTNISLAGHPYTLIIDTGSSDTWIAASDFECTSRVSHARLPQKNCGFGNLYDAVDSRTYSTIPGRAFSVKYSDGEYLMGDMGVEQLSVGAVDGGKGGLTVNQTIGVVERGWWMGDGRSSGLMGLAYPTLASNYRDLNYTTVVGSLFETHQIPAIFSLALSRPTQQAPTAGGLLAIGGIPDVSYSTPFVSVPVTPIVSNTYAFYTIPIDGFSITPPSSSSDTLPPFKNISSDKSTRSQNITAGKSTRRQNTGAGQGAPLKMIIDSGSTLLYLPDSTADYIASLFDPPARYVAASNTYMTACHASQPRFGVIIAGQTFYVNPADMLNREGRGRCSLAVQRQEEGMGCWEMRG